MGRAPRAGAAGPGADANQEIHRATRPACTERTSCRLPCAAQVREQVHLSVPQGSNKISQLSLLDSKEPGLSRNEIRSTPPRALLAFKRATTFMLHPPAATLGNLPALLALDRCDIEMAPQIEPNLQPVETGWDVAADIELFAFTGPAQSNPPSSSDTSVLRASYFTSPLHSANLWRPTMVDWYTKGALTIIALALVTIAIQQTIGAAQSQTTPAPAQTNSLCGGRDNPCSVTNYCHDRNSNEWRLCDTFFRP
jgi:hypothetical protein